MATITVFLLFKQLVEPLIQITHKPQQNLFLSIINKEMFIEHFLCTNFEHLDLALRYTKGSPCPQGMKV